MIKSIENYIVLHKDEFSLKGPIVLDEVAVAEDLLGFKFDEDYSEYLLKFGKISFMSLELYGLGVPRVSGLNVISATALLRKEFGNFPNRSVVLEDIGEENWVIYKMNEGVFQFNRSSITLLYESLEEYVCARFDEVTK